MKNIWRTGVIFAAIGFLSQFIHYVFQAVVSHRLDGKEGEFGLIGTTLAFVTFLNLPLAVATQAVTHYIARFHFSGDDARLHGLLAGCRKFLFHISVAGSILAIVLVKPLSDFFHIPRTSLTLIALVCALGTLWASYVTALCQGLGWFKRLALIGLLSAILRLAFGGTALAFWPAAEWGVLASVVLLSANLILFFWKKEFPRRSGNVVSPWTAEFAQFLIVSIACVVGSFFFLQGDALVAQRYFSAVDRDAYISAALLARALPTTAGPLLIILFTHRSSQHHHGDALWEQLKLVGLYAAGLIFGAVCLYLLRGFCLQLLHRNTPGAAAMIGPFAMAMACIGLLQAVGTWALASRWIKISILYGVLGLAYWLALLVFGRTPTQLLGIMPLASGAAFVILFLVWLMAMRWHKIGAPEET